MPFVPLPEFPRSITRALLESSSVTSTGSIPKDPWAALPKSLIIVLSPVIKSTLNKVPLEPVPASKSITSAVGCAAVELTHNMDKIIKVRVNLIVPFSFINNVASN